MLGNVPGKGMRAVFEGQLRTTSTQVLSLKVLAPTGRRGVPTWPSRKVARRQQGLDLARKRFLAELDRLHSSPL